MTEYSCQIPVTCFTTKQSKEQFKQKCTLQTALKRLWHQRNGIVCLQLYMVCLWQVIGLNPYDVHTPNLHTSTPNAFIYFNAQVQRRLIKGFRLATFTSAATRWIWNYNWGLDRDGPSAKACNGVCCQYATWIFIQRWLLQWQRWKKRTALLSHAGLLLLLLWHLARATMRPPFCSELKWRPW